MCVSKVSPRQESTAVLCVQALVGSQVERQVAGGQVAAGQVAGGQAAEGQVAGDQVAGEPFSLYREISLD